MKVIAFLILVCLSLNALANPIKELEASFDNYQYTMTVEWDQKDQSFYHQKTNEFLEQISQHVLQNGVTKEEIISLVEQKVANKALVDSMKLKMSLMPNMSFEELSQFLKDSSSEFYTRGASWISLDWEMIGYVAGGTVLLGAIIWFYVNYDCAQYEFRRSYDCDTSNCYKKVCTEYVKR